MPFPGRAFPPHLVVYPFVDVHEAPPPCLRWKAKVLFPLSLGNVRQLKPLDIFTINKTKTGQFDQVLSIFL